MKLVAVAVVLAASSAHAEAPIGAIVNPGASIAWVESEHAIVGTMQVDAGYRWNPQTMLGVHFGSATPTEDFSPVDLGLSVHVGFDGPVYVAAWIGAQRAWSGSTGTTTAFGLSVGWDVARRDPHRVSLTGSVETSIYTSNRPLTYTAVGLGVAYRFWD